jgi:hypothetical protein
VLLLGVLVHAGQALVGRCAGTQFDPAAVEAFCAANPVALERDAATAA